MSPRKRIIIGVTTIIVGSALLGWFFHSRFLLAYSFACALLLVTTFPALFGKKNEDAGGEDAGHAPVLGRYRNEVLNTPMTEERIPDPGHMVKPAAYYAEMHETAVALYDASPPPSKADSELIYACQVHAQWGLICAEAEAVPYALKMLDSAVPEAREDGAGVLAAIGKNAGVIDVLLASFEREYEATNGAREPGQLETIDSMVAAFGALKSRKAIPALAKLLRDPEADGDTRWMAMESLSKIAKRRFDKQEKPVDAALEWLDAHAGHEPGTSQRTEKNCPG